MRFICSRFWPDLRKVAERGRITSNSFSPLSNFALNGCLAKRGGIDTPRSCHRSRLLLTFSILRSRTTPPTLKFSWLGFTWRLFTWFSSFMSMLCSAESKRQSICLLICFSVGCCHPKKRGIVRWLSSRLASSLKVSEVRWLSCLRFIDFGVVFRSRWGRWVLRSYSVRWK